ncbi:acyl-CoA dehydrogenase [Xanthobacter tagetidis]|jgi:alkylation response protein AidB-like acyl-CoA dehydrogenase|uniref:Acyl-CoA dehydrogenase n=1 Tax=Xanthobacter tagetidis TaxID=60216 RepID=A0A3L7AMM3_9HYPH|nr:acyl-CoA dehydrogenase [Xanthobacter tagetidis]MBB6307926.1 alkylation response protein AidB-like acyl-CoA dehydrogenase [Xanthobacter tagetidis]RLP81577.1 acyl-CoA dehydrogenase [Xanthobacter tagetidis]
MPSETEAMLAAAAGDLLDGEGGVARARARRDAGGGLDRAVWSRMAAMGWFSLLLPEAHGGLGLAPSDAVDFAQEIGARIAPEPVVAAIAAQPLLAACGTPAADTLLARAAGGAAVICAAPAERTDDGPGSAFQGLAFAPADVDVALAFDPPNRRLLALDPAEARTAATVDGGTLAFLADGPDAVLVAEGASAQAAFLAACDVQRLLYAAELCGLMARALDMTLDYMRLRRQFGQPIGAFQALQHRAATHFVDVRATRALVREAGRAFGTQKQSGAAAAAKAAAGAAALRVLKDCIQLHGAIGFADEHDIGLYLRRAMVLAASAGTPRTCRAVFGTARAAELDAPLPRHAVRAAGPDASQAG